MKRRTVLQGIAATAIVAPTAAHAAKTHNIDITNFKFSPDALDVSVGDTVVFTNKDGAPHTATALDGSWDTGRLGKNKSGEVVITGKMTGAYRCNIHRSMKATLTIS